MRKKALKSVWFFKDGHFMARRWEIVETQIKGMEDSVSAPPLAAISVNLVEETTTPPSKGLKDSALPF